MNQRVSFHLPVDILRFPYRVLFIVCILKDTDVKCEQNEEYPTVDDKFAIDHEDDDHTSNILEIQLGKMFTPSIGGYVEYLNNTGGVKVYDEGVGVGLRIAF